MILVLAAVEALVSVIVAISASSLGEGWSGGVIERRV